MENQEFQLDTYPTNGVEKIVKGAIRATLTDPRERVHGSVCAVEQRSVPQRRAQAEKDGENIPPFLIASITSACDLHCAGCYSRQNHACVDAEPCPFSPYSDINVKTASLREALHSPLFTALRDRNVLMEDHAGGCVLFERRETVEALLAESRGK